MITKIMRITKIIEVLQAFVDGKELLMGPVGDQVHFSADLGDTGEDILQRMLAGARFEVAQEGDL